MISSNTTSESSLKQTSERDQSLTSEWLLRFAANCGQPLDSARVALWREEFSEFEPDVLETAFREVLHEHVFNCLPTVGEVYEKASDLRDAKWLRLYQQEMAAKAEEARVAHEQWLSNQPSSEELGRRQLNYCEEMGKWGRTLLELQRKTQPKIKAEPVVVIAWPERLAQLEEQKRQILVRYPRPVESVVREG
jgi:hypothetical protein